jgi:ATP adenylyltransferase
VSLDHLWAGWRAAYVASIADAGSPEGSPATPVAGEEAGGAGPDADPDGCVFCRIAASDAGDATNYVVWRGELVLAMLNAYPYASGHLMVMPVRHVGRLEGLRPDESAALWSAAEHAVRALGAAYAPEGLNLGMNLGRAAGAGIPEHLHLHVVPRWLGDTNFMTAVASVRVLPEAITDSWSKLRSAWPA